MAFPLMPIPLVPTKVPLEIASKSRNLLSVLGTTITMNFPEGTSQGDLIIAFMGFSSAGTYVTPAGWTRYTIGYATQSSVSILVKTYEASDGSSITFTCANSSYRHGLMFRIPNGVFETKGNTVGHGGTSPLTPTLESSANGGLLFGVFKLVRGNYAWSTPAGMQLEDTTGYYQNGNFGDSIYIFVEKIEAGIVGNRTSTATGTFGCSASLFTVSS